MSAPRVLPAAAFDALQASAEKFGGVGAGWFRERIEDATSPPLCIIGHANTIGLWVYDALLRTDICAPTSDHAVIVINARAGKTALIDRDDRVPFAEWCAELGVERGT